MHEAGQGPAQEHCRQEQGKVWTHARLCGSPDNKSCSGLRKG